VIEIAGMPWCGVSYYDIHDRMSSYLSISIFWVSVFGMERCGGGESSQFMRGKVIIWKDGFASLNDCG